MFQTHTKPKAKFMVLYSQYFSLSVMKQQTWRRAKRFLFKYVKGKNIWEPRLRWTHNIKVHLKDIG
jgi:hypothetical protein